MKNINICHKLTLLLLISTSVCQLSASVTSGLVGEWLFTGNTLDSSGNGFHGAASSSSAGIDRLNQPDNALNLNGSEWVEIQDDPALRPANGWTISAWVKPETMTSPYNERIIDKGGNDHTGIAGYALLYNTERKFTFGNMWGGGSQGDVVSLTQVNTSEWFFLVGTYDGINASLYVNNTLEASSPMTWNIDSTKPIQIGRFQGNISYPHWTSTFVGGIDDVRIYNRAINDSEVAALYLVNGSVSTVPEPTGFLASLIVCCIGILHRRRPRRSAH